MTQFLHYARLSDWDENDIILVDFLDNETAQVRTFLQDNIHGPLPVTEAISDAQRFKHNVPGMRGIGAYLRDGVEWSPRWGELIEMQ